MYVFLATSLVPWLLFSHLINERWIGRIAIFSLSFMFFMGAGMIVYYMMAGQVFQDGFHYDLTHTEFLFYKVSDWVHHSDSMGEMLFYLFFITYWLAYIDVLHVFIMFLSNFSIWQIPFLLVLGYITIYMYDGVVLTAGFRTHHDMSLEEWLRDLVFHDHTGYRSEAEYLADREAEYAENRAIEEQQRKDYQKRQEEERAKNTGQYYYTKTDAWK